MDSKQARILALIVSAGIGVSVLVTITLRMNGNKPDGRLTWDDAYITLSAVRTFATTGRLAVSPQAPLLAGVTSPVHALLLASIYREGGEEVLARGFALLCACGIVVVSVLLLFSAVPSPWPAFFSGAYGALLLGLGGQLSFLSLSGMETTFFLMTMGLALWSFSTRGIDSLTGLLAGLHGVTRPDGLLLAPVLLAAYLMNRGRPPRTALVSFAVAATLPTAVQAAVIGLQTGLLLPNTLSAKQCFFGIENMSLIQRGSVFLQAAAPYFRSIAGLSCSFLAAMILAAVAWVGRRSQSPRLDPGGGKIPQPSARQLVSFCIMYTVLFSAGTLTSMPDGPIAYQGRYYAPIYYTMVLMTALLPSWIAGWPRSKGPARYAALVLAGILASWVVYSLGTERKRLTLAHQAAAAFHDVLRSQAQWFHDNVPNNARIGVTDLGIMQFYSGHPIIDLVGLATPEMKDYYRDAGGKCRPLNQRNLTSAVKRLGINYMTPAESWDHELMGDLTKRLEGRLEKLSVPGYPAYKIRLAVSASFHPPCNGPRDMVACGDA